MAVPAVVIANNAAVTASRSPSVAFGAGYTPAANDVVVFACNDTTAAHAITVPSGWVNLHPRSNNTVNNSDQHSSCSVYHGVTFFNDTATTEIYTATNLWDV